MTAVSAPIALKLTVKTTLTLEAAVAVADAIEAGAVRDALAFVVAVVDDGGHILVLHRMDGAQIGSIDVAILKARTAIRFKRPTRIFQDAIDSHGRATLLCIPDGLPLDGGVPLKVGEEVVGAVGVSGASDELDGNAAREGAAVLDLVRAAR
jgi:uncharacterized protein GlcG (DUF336 family)